MIQFVSCELLPTSSFPLPVQVLCVAYTARTAITTAITKRVWMTIVCTPSQCQHHTSETQRTSFHLRSYEAFVIYTFLNLCLGYVGGAGEVEVKMNGFVLQPSVMACTCCLKPMVCRKRPAFGSDWLLACSGLEPLVSGSLQIMCAQ